MSPGRLLVFATSCLLNACGGKAVQPTKVESPTRCSDGVILSDSVSSQDQTVDPSVLVFRIESADPVGPSKQLRYRLRNNSLSALWVNARMLHESAIGEIVIHVAESSAGKPLDTNCRVHPSLPQYVLLTPQSEISIVRSLGCLEFPNEGPWRLTAEYHDRSSRVPPPPSGALWFNGTVQSNELEFRAKPTQVPPATSP
jgi:hypothetical protein